MGLVMCKHGGACRHAHMRICTVYVYMGHGREFVMGKCPPPVVWCGAGGECGGGGGVHYMQGGHLPKSTLSWPDCCSCEE